MKVALVSPPALLSFHFSSTYYAKAHATPVEVTLGTWCTALCRFLDRRKFEGFAESHTVSSENGAQVHVTPESLNSANCEFSGYKVITLGASCVSQRNTSPPCGPCGRQT